MLGTDRCRDLPKNIPPPHSYTIVIDCVTVSLVGVLVAHLDFWRLGYIFLVTLRKNRP